MGRAGQGILVMLCSRDYGSRIKVDRRGSFTFLSLFFFLFPPLLARRNGAAVVGTAVRVRELIFRVLSAASSIYPRLFAFRQSCLLLG